MFRAGAKATTGVSIFSSEDQRWRLPRASKISWKWRSSRVITAAYHVTTRRRHLFLLFSRIQESTSRASLQHFTGHNKRRSVPRFTLKLQYFDLLCTTSWRVGMLCICCRLRFDMDLCRTTCQGRIYASCTSMFGFTKRGHRMSSSSGTFSVLWGLIMTCCDS